MTTVSKRRQQITGWVIIAVAAVTPLALLALGVDLEDAVRTFVNSR